MKRHKWTDIKARTKAETRRRIESEAQHLSEDLHLSQLRKARGLTQETMAELLGVSPAEVSKMERPSTSEARQRNAAVHRSIRFRFTPG